MSWLLANCNDSFANGSCQPANPYANITLPHATTGRSIPRIKFAINPLRAAPRYRRVIRRIGPDGKITYSYIQDAAGVFTSDGGYAMTGTVDGTVAAAVAGKHARSRGIHLDDAAANDSVVDYRIDISATTNEAGVRDSAIFTNASNLLPPMSPVDMDQVSGRSSDRIKQLQARLGGDMLTERHGKPPPMASPFYQSGALHESSEVAGEAPQGQRMLLAV